MTSIRLAKRAAAQHSQKQAKKERMKEREGRQQEEAWEVLRQATKCSGNCK